MCAFGVLNSILKKATQTHHCTEHFSLRQKLKSCTVPFLYRSDLVTFRRMLYRPNVCNCTIPYVHRTVPAYAVRDPAYIAEVVALTLVRPLCSGPATLNAECKVFLRLDTPKYWRNKNKFEDLNILTMFLRCYLHMKKPAEPNVFEKVYLWLN